LDFPSIDSISIQLGRNKMILQIQWIYTNSSINTSYFGIEVP